MSTKIEWATDSWNPVTGCTPISEGCAHCYARRMAQRLKGRYGYPQDDPFRVTFHPDKLDHPLKWKKPRRILVPSMGDLFHDDLRCSTGFDTDFDQVWKVFEIMIASPHHTFFPLTKRPKNMLQFYQTWIHRTDKIDHIIPGISAENQQRYDERWPILAQIPAAKWFFSLEPLLGPIDRLYSEYCMDCKTPLTHIGPYKTTMARHLHENSGNFRALIRPDWVIVGGETGPGARPMHPDWVRSIRDQCQESGIPFFFKGWGDWEPTNQNWGNVGVWVNDVFYYKTPPPEYNGQYMIKVGKKKSGHLLDGREWNEFPERG